MSNFSYNTPPATRAALQRYHDEQRQARLRAAASRLRADKPYDTSRSPADNEAARQRDAAQAEKTASAMEDFLPRPNEHCAMLFSTPEDFIHRLPAS